MSNLIKPNIQKTIQQGISYIPNEEYHKGPGISRSGLMKLKRSPYHYWNQYINLDYEPDEPTPILILGSFFHTLVLEPHLLEERFFVNPESETLDEEDKKDKEKKKELKEKKNKIKEEKKHAEETGKLIISKKEANKAYAMLESLKRKDGGELYECIRDTKIAKIEQSIYWTDEETGILCKARPDIIYGNIVIDLKTTANASPWNFSKISYDKGYHIQAAMVKEGLRIVENINMSKFRFIAIETSKPYVVTNPPFSQEALEVGHNEFKSLLNKYKECSENNHWPSYEEQEINIPRYASYN